MGKEKALLHLHGIPFIERIANTLTEIFGNVFLVADESSRFEFLQLPVVPDMYKDCGPLGGIHSALLHAPTERVFIVSCDTPLIQSEFIYFLLQKISDEDVLVPSLGSFVHPLCGFYKKSTMQSIEERLQEKQFSVMDFLQTRNSRKVVLSVQEGIRFEQSLRNVNTPEEYQQCITST